MPPTGAKWSKMWAYRGYFSFKPDWWILQEDKLAASRPHAVSAINILLLKKVHGTSFEDTPFISLRLILRNRVCSPTQWFYLQFNGAGISIPTGFFNDISLHFWFIPPGWFIMLKPSGYLLWQNVCSGHSLIFFGGGQVICFLVLFYLYDFLKCFG